ncbi:MAG: hypothetical protein QXT14_04375 [Candidatus Bathyarchaeia archaeon]
MSHIAKRTLETSIVILLVMLTTYAYVVILGGLPYDLLMDAYGLLKRNFELVNYCWISEGLGRANDRLAFTTSYILLALLNSLGVDLSSACLIFLLLLWVLGGGSMYLLVKRFSRSRLTGLTAMFIYLGAATALRGLWRSLDASALYVLMPLVLLTVDEAHKRRDPLYGFYTALTCTLFSGALAKLGNLAVLILTILAYFTVKTYGEDVKLKTVMLFLTTAGFSWLMMNIWWIAIPPSLNVESFNPICLIAFPVSALTLLLASRVDKMDMIQALAIISPALVLMDPREVVSLNVSPEVLAIISVDATILVALGLKRFSEVFSNYISISLVLEGDGVREYDLVKPVVFLIASGVILYQGLTIPPLWTSSLNIPEYYGELAHLLPPGDYRILTMPVTWGEVFYYWSDRKYEKPVESLVLDKSTVYGREFTVLNDLTRKAGFWRILSTLNVKFILLHYDVSQDDLQNVDPRLIETRLNYSFIVEPSLANGIVNVASEAVKPITRDLGFVQLINFNPETYHYIEARCVEEGEAQSEIHLFAYGEACASEEPNLNQTFSFAYILPRAMNWLDYNYLEFWIKINSSDTITIQVQDVFGHWALWRLNLKERDWNLAIIRLNDADLDVGLDRSKVAAIVFSVHSKIGRIVEVEVGGIFLDEGVVLGAKPIELFGKFNHQLTVYRLLDGFETPNVYAVEEVLKSEGDIFENILKDEFDPRSKAYVDGEILQVSHAELEYVKLEPTKYRVTVHNFQDRFLIVLSEKFDPGWALYVGEPDLMNMLIEAKHQNVKHVKVNGFLNGWYIEAEEVKPLTLTIVYRPQLQLEVLRIVSTVFMILSITIILLRKKTVSVLKHIKTYGRETDR